ncbi:MAG: YCF48-related protein [Ignavibacteriaceae bacterium]
MLFRTKFGDGYWTNEYITRSSSPFGYLYTEDGNSGYVVGDSGRALKTTDHGYTWTAINTGVSSKLENVTFSTNNLGWIVGDNGTILKTSDGGNSWLLNNSFSEYHFDWVTFTSDSVGWIVGTLGSILKTVNAGASWELVPSGTTVDLRMIYFKDPNHGYIVGDSGTVLLYDTSYVTSVNKKQTNVKYGNFEIYQNYPNPFNPNTLIRFNLPFSSNVKIEVFNSLGEKVKELLNEQRSAGSYDLNFNSSGLASGVYFYRIEAKSIDSKSEFRDSKKMVLLK